MGDLPDFDTLLAMHRENPESLEKLRRRLTRKLLHSAPDSTRQRLEGLQFRIDMELRRATNPTARCLRISDMMHDSFSRLNHCLQHPFDEVSTRQNRPKADILPMSRRRPGTARSSKDNADSSKPH
ncbi:DUF3135 domain-containing protein [Pseudohongiella sp.]|uniref:DUF3135 domain-containing protein n=1 Tax=marine sediment metagenome TaxID=412755 RepID=A0A0F9W121_9ZZZZ|nr:DUF3135 domain-containing protein [Pseudohongiella sp.]HDZ09572.1 DUF3135 domain-containing protein [Pseudohongiella sp.]HEA62486.1 DUF3135 domain-containing protein [Pseudohongiella sp.]